MGERSVDQWLAADRFGRAPRAPGVAGDPGGRGGTSIVERTAGCSLARCGSDRTPYGFALEGEAYRDPERPARKLADTTAPAAATGTALVTRAFRNRRLCGPLNAPAPRKDKSPLIGSVCQGPLAFPSSGRRPAFAKPSCFWSARTRKRFDPPTVHLALRRGCAFRATSGKRGLRPRKSPRWMEWPGSGKEKK